MSKVRTLSRFFMSGHPRAGEPTYFIEKFLNSNSIDYKSQYYLNLLIKLNPHIDITEFFESLVSIEDKKHHTIRSGNHFKSGDSISIRVWSGKPYKSKQICLLPDIIIKTFDFQIPTNLDLKKIANNDGLSEEDFVSWFPKEFSGQMIVWNHDINYDTGRNR